MFCPFLMVEVIETTSPYSMSLPGFYFSQITLAKRQMFFRMLLQKKLWKMETETIKIFLNNLILVFC